MGGGGGEGQRRAVEEAVESKSMAIINHVLVAVAVAVAAAPSSLEPRVTDCPEGSGVDSSRMRAQRGV